MTNVRNTIKKAGGRPSKATPKRMQEVIKGITAGLPYDTSCALAGIHYTTFNNWMKAGESAVSGKFFKFFEDVKKAEAIAESVHIAEIKKAAAGRKADTTKGLEAKEGIWQASAWLLERRYPQKWGKKEQVKQEITGPDGGPIKIKTAQDLTDDELAEIAIGGYK